MKTNIHIWDLPVRKIYIKLKEGFRENFFGLAHQKFKTWDKLANSVGVKRGDTLLARNWKDGQCCCPLYIILKISDALDISKRDIEKNIQEIKVKTKLGKKGGKSGKPIINPILPVKINEYFTEILGHICGDGTIVRKNPKKGVSLKYVNSEPVLIKSFQERIKKIFGEINANIQIREGGGYRRKNFCLQYSSIVSLIIISVFDYKTGDKMDIPNFIFKLSKKSQSSFLRALFDDEGSVNIKDKSISFGLKPIKPLKKIRKLLINLGFSPSKIFKTGGIKRMKLGGKENVLLFKRFIGFKHLLKQKRLSLVIEKGWKFDRYGDNTPAQKIIPFLLEKSEATTSEIISMLNRQPSTVRGHLLNLKKKRLIFNRKNSKGNIWRLNE